MVCIRVNYSINDVLFIEIVLNTENINNKLHFDDDRRGMKCNSAETALVAYLKQCNITAEERRN